MDRQLDFFDGGSESYNHRDYSGLDLRGREFSGITFTECDFSEALLGGCRFEDCVVVTKKGCEFLSSHPYDWEIA